MTVRLKIIQLCTKVWTRKWHRGKFRHRETLTEKSVMIAGGISKYVESVSLLYLEERNKSLTVEKLYN